MLVMLVFSSHLDTSWTVRSLSNLARFSTWNGSRSTMLALPPHRGASSTCTMFSMSSWKRYSPRRRKKRRRMLKPLLLQEFERAAALWDVLQIGPKTPNNVNATCEMEEIFLFVNQKLHHKTFNRIHFVPPLSFLYCLSKNSLYLVEVSGWCIKYGKSVKLITKYRMINRRGADWTLQMFKELKLLSAAFMCWQECSRRQIVLLFSPYLLCASLLFCCISSPRRYGDRFWPRRTPSPTVLEPNK